MKFDHTVKYKGKYYPAGVDVPVPGNKPVAKKNVAENSEKFAQTSKE